MDIVRDDHAQARRIHIGNAGEIENVHQWWLLAGQRLKVEQVSQGEWRERAVHTACGEGSGETEDHGGGSFALLAFDVEGGTLRDLWLGHRVPSAGRVWSTGVDGLRMFGLVVPSSTMDNWPSVVMTSPVALPVVLGTLARSTSA